MFFDPFFRALIFASLEGELNGAHFYQNCKIDIHANNLGWAGVSENALYFRATSKQDKIFWRSEYPIYLDWQHYEM